MTTTLDDAAKAYRTACKDLDDAQNAYREADQRMTDLLLAQEQAQDRKATAARFLRLVAQYGPPEEWTRDYMQDGQLAQHSLSKGLNAPNPYVNPHTQGIT